MFKKHTLTLVAILVIASLLGACAPNQTATNNGGNQTVIVIEGDNSGDISVQQGIVENDDSNNAVAAVATETPALTEAPIEEVDSNVCFATWWHNGWDKGPKRISTTGVLNRAELEKGMAMQASWDKWTTTTTVGGYLVPKTFETNNDATHVVVCDDVAYMPSRDPNAETVKFWEVSYMQLTADGLLICKDDTGTPGEWKGYCAGNKTTITGVKLSDIVIPADLTENWTSLMSLRQSWNDNVPQYGILTEMWIPQ